MGGGALQANGPVMGPDTDPAFHFGAGLKVALAHPVALRLEFRENMSDRQNDEFGGIAYSEEFQLGLAFNLDRPPPAAPPTAPPPAPPVMTGASRARRRAVSPFLSASLVLVS